MSAAPRILAVGVVDERGITRSPSGAEDPGRHLSWRELGVDAPGNGRTYRALAGKADSTFRRLDRQTRALVLAAEACGIERFLDEEQCSEAALLIETTCGSLEVDLRYARALDDGIVHAAIFPYTLQSTCLGDVALRHGLRGPTLSLSIDRSRAGESLREARRLLVPGGPRHAVVGTVDALAEPVPGAPLALRAVVCLLQAPGGEAGAFAPWPELEERTDPFGELASALG